jgi:hypothetical protein
MSEHSAPVAPLVEDVLNAAHEVAAAGLEMDSRVEDELHAALLHLVRAVYAHEDALDLQHELEADGVREPAVFDVSADAPPFTSYSAHVEQIITAADRVAEYTAAPDASAFPQYALAPVCSLVEAVTAYQAHPTAARQWHRAGNRPALLPEPGPRDRPPPPSPSPPHLPTRPEVEKVTAHAVDPRPGGDSVALVQDPPQMREVVQVVRAAPRLRCR